MPAASPSALGLLLLFSLLSWRAWVRFRRLVGRQRLSRIRPRITLSVYAALIALLTFAARSHPERLWWLAAGLAAAVPLALFGLRLTRFEPTRQGLWYTPNAYLGITLSLMFVARILYRLIELFLLDGGTQHGAADFVRSAPTLAVFGLLAGYNIAYAIGLMRWRAGLLRAKREREARDNP